MCWLLIIYIFIGMFILISIQIWGVNVKCWCLTNIGIEKGFMVIESLIAVCGFILLSLSINYLRMVPNWCFVLIMRSLDILWFRPRVIAISSFKDSKGKEIIHSMCMV